jgi:hypothetical protein
MTPPPAQATAGRLPRSPAPRAPRRVSGPARRRHRVAPARRRATRAARVLAWLRALPDARLLDRLVRGRGWIALVGVGLIGIVFLQVSLLNLNAGISRAVTAAETLERQNASLREDISRLDTGDRLAGGAAKLGLIMPSAGEVTFLDARQADGRRAAAGIRPPKPVPPGTVAAAPAAGVAGTTTPAAGAVAPGTAGTATPPAAATSAGTPAATGTTATGTTATGTAATGTTPAGPASTGTVPAAGATPATGTTAPATAPGAAPTTTAGGAPAASTTTASTATPAGAG